MSRGFLVTLSVSAAAHLIAITPIYSLDLPRNTPIHKNLIVVDYIAMEESPRVEMAGFDVREKLQAVQRQEPVKPLEVVGPAVVKGPQQIASYKKEIKARLLSQKFAKAEAQSKQVAQAEAKIRTTKDYVGYLEIIRQKIKVKLKENYKYYSNEGSIYLIFVLRSDGTLPAYDIDRSKSTQDDTLLNIATVSLIEAAPFASFPKALSLPKMTFNLVISFKKQ